MSHRLYRACAPGIRLEITFDFANSAATHPHICRRINTAAPARLVDGVSVDALHALPTWQTVYTRRRPSCQQRYDRAETAEFCPAGDLGGARCFAPPLDWRQYRIEGAGGQQRYGAGDSSVHGVCLTAPGNHV